MKTAIIVVSAIVAVAALAGAVVALVFHLTSGMTETADSFFRALRAKDYAAAYQCVSEDFRASTPQADFVKFVESSALARFKEASWNRRSISNGRGELEGSITTDGGGVVPMKLGLVKENGKWRIYSIRKPQAGLTRDDAEMSDESDRPYETSHSR